MREERKKRPRSVLDLLDEEEMVEVLGVFPLRQRLTPAQLQSRLPGLGRSRVRRRLTHLVDAGLVDYSRTAGLPPDAHYEMNERGRELLLIPPVGAAWERRWRIGGEPHDGLGAIRIAADRCYVPVMRALADASLGLRELARRLPEIPYSSLVRGLQEMVAENLANRQGAPDGSVRYAAGVSARELTVIHVLAVRLEWLRGEPLDLAYASDLSALVHALAPIAELPRGLYGECHLCVEGCEQCREPAVCLRADSGRLVALPSAPAVAPVSVARATPLRWCEALLLRSPGLVQRTGNQELIAGVLGALGGVLVPEHLSIRLGEC